MTNKNNEKISLSKLLKIIYLYEELKQSNNKLNFFYTFIFFLIPINISMAIYFRSNTYAIPMWIIVILFSFIYCLVMPISLHFALTKFSPYAREIKNKSYFIFKDKTNLTEKLDWFENDKYSLILCDQIFKNVTFEVSIKNKVFYLSIVLFLFDFLLMTFAWLISLNIIK